MKALSGQASAVIHAQVRGAARRFLLQRPFQAAVWLRKSVAYQAEGAYRHPEGVQNRSIGVSLRKAAEAPRFLRVFELYTPAASGFIEGWLRVRGGPRLPGRRGCAVGDGKRAVLLARAVSASRSKTCLPISATGSPDK